MIHHKNCNQHLPGEGQHNKQYYIRNTFINSQADLDGLKLDGNPKLVKLSDNFVDKVIII